MSSHKAVKVDQPHEPESSKPDLASEPSADALLRLQAMSASGRLEETATETTKLIREYPRAAVLHNLLGGALVGLGRSDDAISSYVQAVTLKPDYTDAHVNLGKLLHGLGLLDEAAKCFRHAQLADPACAPAFIGLANVLRDAGRADDAGEQYRQGISLDPGNSNAHTNLGIMHLQRGECLEAITSFCAALRLDAGNAPALVNFASAVAMLGDTELAPDCTALVGRCLDAREIDSSSVSGAATKMLLPDLRALPEGEPETLDGLAGMSPEKRNLLCSVLKSVVLADPDAESVLTRARTALLSNMSKLNEHGDMLLALAVQGHLNEFIWSVSPSEDRDVRTLLSRVVEAVESGGSPATGELLLLAAYRPLVTNDLVREWVRENFDGLDEALKPVFQRLVVDPVRELEIRDQLEQVTEIDDSVSVNVRAQYEENPYPRWDNLSVVKPQPCTATIGQEILPHRTELQETSPAPDVLIAGCGTGRQPIIAALRYQNSTVLAVDLSLTSLAFAVRKAEELNVTNIRFAQGDIMRLGQLDCRFDVIECSGVLHHMGDPGAGLEALLGLLKPGGYIKIGLYSAPARAYLDKLREIASEKGLDATLQGMRDFRAAVRASDTPEAKKVQQSQDFYSASALRDLIFHVQEHLFTVPQVGALLARNGLEFLGFVFANPRVKTIYANRFPGDPNCLDLENWHQVEQEYPDIFRGMYQFWCRKAA